MASKKASLSKKLLAEIKEKEQAELEAQIKNELQSKLNAVENAKVKLAEHEKSLADYVKDIDDGKIKLNTLTSPHINWTATGGISRVSGPGLAVNYNCY